MATKTASAVSTILPFYRILKYYTLTAVLPPCVMHTFFRIANILLQTGQQQKFLFKQIGVVIKTKKNQGKTLGYTRQLSAVSCIT